MLLLIFSPLGVRSQDTLQVQEVKLHSSIIRQSLLRSTAAAAIVDSAMLQLHNNNSLVPALNTVPGVRMEERSPGSYRLSIRGSLLRSPFGVRNVKCYIDEFPLTDAGGNTYINSIGLNAMQSIEILKGPDGSLFGANSGGVIILDPFMRKPGTFLDLGGGSWGAVKAVISHGVEKGKHSFQLNGSYQRADGYRDNSTLRRGYLQAANRWRYNQKNSLKLFAFYSDLSYETPGGLTRAQFDSAARQARPATATLPGAAEQKAAVVNRTLFAGLAHDWTINSLLENTTAFFGSTVSFRNPFITNYETREEDTWGARSFFRLHDKDDAKRNLRWQYFLGFEGQQTYSSITNFRNVRGEKSDLISAGKIRSGQYFYFSRISLEFSKRLSIEAGASLNYYGYRFRDSSSLSKHFIPQWMPRAAISWLVSRGFNLRASVAKGYSPPTTGEIRPSDNNLYTALGPEKGWNKEVGARYSSPGNRVWLDIAVYQFELRNAILRQQNSLGEEYFVNDGSTRQRGIEMHAAFTIIDSTKSQHPFVTDLRLRSSVTLQHFRFTDYKTAPGDYTGNWLTGVPDQTFVSGLILNIKQKINVFVEHNYTGRLPLNDANTEYAEAYNIFKCRAGYQCRLKKAAIEIYAVVENIGDAKYSLGNDLNAAGKRYFNAAPGRNYFAGIIFRK